MIKEEQYTTSINVGTFSTRQEAEAQLDYLRKKYGFSEENSYVNGTTVTVEIEKSVTDDSYYYEMVDALKKEKQNLMNKYKMVSESRKNDKGETVPEKCDKCGGKVSVQIHGEPVFVCEKCGKYFGTMPFNIKEGKMKTISIKESQLRKIVQETINESIEELIYNKSDSYNTVEDELYDVFRGEIDYLYNEGVISYDDSHIIAMANGKIPVPYQDLIESVLYDYASTLSKDAMNALKIYLAQGNSDKDIKGAADRAVKEYAKNCHEMNFGFSTIKESTLRKIIYESISNILNEYYDFDDEDEPTTYGIGTLVYKIDKDEISDYEGMDADNGDDFNSIPEAVEVIKQMCTYRKNSVEWDIRYANNWIPIFYVYDKITGDRVDNNLYISKNDIQYKQHFNPIGTKIIAL